MNIKNPKTMENTLAWISIGIIVLICIGLMAYHTPAILAVATFWLGYWWRGVNLDETIN